MSAPSPVPAVELLKLSPDFVADPYPVYAELRARGPVHRVLTPEGEDLWLVVGHEECRAAYTDPRFSRDWRTHGHLAPVLPAYAYGPGNAHVLLSDPPDHTRMRRLVAREFTPRRIEALAPRVQQVTDALLDAMAADGARAADVIDALAFPLPMTVICDLLGVPDLDRDAFRGWSNEVVAPTSPEAEQAAYGAAMPYLTGLIEDKRKAPGEDLLSALIHTADEDGDRLSQDELLSMAFLLIVAGHETTVNLIGNGLRALFNHPDQLALLRGDLDGLIDGAVEEALRYDGPVEGSTPRIVGAACSALLLTVVKRVAHAGRVRLISLASGSALVAVLGSVPTLAWAVAVAAPMGLLVAMSGGMTAGLVQTNTAPAFLGRVTSVLSLVSLGIAPLMYPVVGAAVAVWSVPTVFVGCSVLCGLAAVVGVGSREVRGAELPK
ncbi:hypothetical protein SSPIM334S_00330 [Streptomyces spiroverticillatus]